MPPSGFSLAVASEEYVGALGEAHARALVPPAPGTWDLSSPTRDQTRISCITGENKAEMVEAVKIVSCLMNEVDAGTEKLIGKGKEASVQLGA